MSFLPHSQKTLTLSMVVGIPLVAALVLSSGRPVTQDYIVQGQDMAAVQEAVHAVGGEITHELGIIGAVGAELTHAQSEALRSQEGFRRVFENYSVQIAGKPPKDVAATAATAATSIAPMCRR